MLSEVEKKRIAGDVLGQIPPQFVSRRRRRFLSRLQRTARAAAAAPAPAEPAPSPVPKPTPVAPAVPKEPFAGNRVDQLSGWDLVSFPVVIVELLKVCLDPRKYGAKLPVRVTLASLLNAGISRKDIDAATVRGVINPDVLKTYLLVKNASAQKSEAAEDIRKCLTGVRPRNFEPISYRVDAIFRPVNNAKALKMIGLWKGMTSDERRSFSLFYDALSFAALKRPPLRSGLPQPSVSLAKLKETMLGGWKTVLIPQVVPGSFPDIYKIDLEGPWGFNKRKVKNAIAFREAKRDYPWPAPRGLVRTWWLAVVMGTPDRQTVLDLVNSKVPISKEGFRTLITLMLLKHFDKIMAHIAHEIEETEERRARKTRIRNIALATFGGIVGLLAPPLAAGLVEIALTGVAVADRRKAAAGMIKAAEQFETSDPAFSDEIERVAKLIDRVAAGDPDAVLFPPEAPPPPAPPPPAPPIAEPPVERVPKPSFQVTVNGDVAFETTDEKAVAQKIIQTAETGDIVDVRTSDGRSGPPVLMTGGGPIRIPPDVESMLRGASPEDRRRFVNEAQQVARQQVVKAKKKGFPWWLLLAVPAGFVISKVA